MCFLNIRFKYWTLVIEYLITLVLRLRLGFVMIVESKKM